MAYNQKIISQHRETHRNDEHEGINGQTLFEVCSILRYGNESDTMKKEEGYIKKLERNFQLFIYIYTIFGVKNSSDK